MQSTAPSSTEQLCLLDPTARSSVPVRVWLVLFGWSLTVNGDMSLDEWEPLVVEALGERYLNRETRRKAAREIKALFGFLRAKGVRDFSGVTPGLMQEWFWAARMTRSGRHRRPAKSTARNRRWVALAAFAEAAALGAAVNPAVVVGPPIARPTDFVSARPLTDEEDGLVMTFSAPGLVATRRPLLVAFARAGATASEIAGVRMGDIDLEAGTVMLSGAAARVAHLDAWGLETLRLFIGNNHPPFAPDDLLCITSTTNESRAAHSVTVRLRDVLLDAGLLGRPGVKARSIRLTAGRRVLDAEGIEAAARFLATPSLDTAADALGHDWRQVDG